MTSTQPEARRRTGAVRRADAVAILGATAASLALTALLFTQLLPLSGALGFAVVAYLLFLVVYALLVSLDERGPAIRDRVAAVVIHSFAVLLVLALVFVAGFTIWRGHSALGHLNLFTRDLSDAGPRDPLSAGGILHAIAGTLEQISIALVVTVPLGLTCAVFLNETTGAFTRLVRTVVEAMTALPSIVAGLFIYATAILMFGFERSGFAASLALSVMMLPIVIRAADVVIRLVPRPLREASYALGASQWRTVWHVVLPTARSGLATAVILGTARGIGETSPVLITAGYTASLNTDPFSGPQVSLPLAAFQLVKSPEPAMIARGFGAAATLLALVLVLFAVARILGGRGPGSLTARQQRRRTKASARDSARYTRSRAGQDRSTACPAAVPEE